MTFAFSSDPSKDVSMASVGDEGNNGGKTNFKASLKRPVYLSSVIVSGLFQWCSAVYVHLCHWCPVTTIDDLIQVLEKDEDKSFTFVDDKDRKTTSVPNDSSLRSQPGDVSENPRVCLEHVYAESKLRLHSIIVPYCHCSFHRAHSILSVHFQKRTKTETDHATEEKKEGRDDEAAKLNDTLVLSNDGIGDGSDGGIGDGSDDGSGDGSDSSVDASGEIVDDVVDKGNYTFMSGSSFPSLSDVHDVSNSFDAVSFDDNSNHEAPNTTPNQEDPTAVPAQAPFTLPTADESP